MIHDYQAGAFSWMVAAVESSKMTGQPLLWLFDAFEVVQLDVTAP